MQHNQKRIVPRPHSVSVIPRLGIVFVIFIFFYLLLSTGGIALAHAGTITWDIVMRVPSPDSTSSWFPDFAVDKQGRLHAVWCETNHREMNYAAPGMEFEGRDFESVFYAMFDGAEWTEANDIIPPQTDIIRNTIAIDRYDGIHMLFDFAPPFGLYYQRTDAVHARSAAEWTAPHLFNKQLFTYMSDIRTGNGSLHAVFDDQGEYEGECPGCGDIFYRRSVDGGITWLPQESLHPTTTGSFGSQLEIDPQGTIFVTWDEGWDRLTGGESDVRYGVMLVSDDDGASWSSPKEVAYPDRTSAQLTVGSDGNDGIVLVWRSVSSAFQDIFFSWSPDGGETWTDPAAIPGVKAKIWTNKLDSYDMATDSVGNIHLVAGGYLPRDFPRRPIEIPPHLLLHLEWDGAEWSDPQIIYSGDWYPEYPHILIERGNQLHVMWHLRKELWQERIPHQIWYAHGESTAPSEGVIYHLRPTANLTATPQETALEMSEALGEYVMDTPVPSFPAAIEDVANSESDFIKLLAYSLSPAIVLIIIVAFIYLKTQNK